MTYESALKAATRTSTILSRRMWTTLGAVIDMDAIRAAGVRIGVDPLGGASLTTGNR